MVVYLAVVGDGDIAVLACHRLMAVRGKVDDAQPRVRQAHRPAGEDAAVVRAAMAQRLSHPFQHGAIDRSLSPQDASDPAHA